MCEIAEGGRCSTQLCGLVIWPTDLRPELKHQGADDAHTHRYYLGKMSAGMAAILTASVGWFSPATIPTRCSPAGCPIKTCCFSIVEPSRAEQVRALLKARITRSNFPLIPLKISLVNVSRITNPNVGDLPEQDFRTRTRPALLGDQYATTHWLDCSPPTSANRVRSPAGSFIPRFSHVGIVPNDAASRRVFSGICHFPRPCIPALLHIQRLDVKSCPNPVTPLVSPVRHSGGVADSRVRRLSWVAQLLMASRICWGRPNDQGGGCWGYPEVLKHAKCGEPLHCWILRAVNCRCARNEIEQHGNLVAMASAFTRGPADSPPQLVGPGCTAERSPPSPAMTLPEVTAVRAVRRPVQEHGWQFHLKDARASNMLAHKSRHLSTRFLTPILNSMDSTPAITFSIFTSAPTSLAHFLSVWVLPRKHGLTLAPAMSDREASAKSREVRVRARRYLASRRAEPSREITTRTSEMPSNISGGQTEHNALPPFLILQHVCVVRYYASLTLLLIIRPRWCGVQTTLFSPRQTEIYSWRGLSGILACGNRAGLTIPLVGGFSPYSPRFALIGSQDLDVKVPPRSLHSAGIQGLGKREIPEKTRRPAASSVTIPTCRNPGATRRASNPVHQGYSWVAAKGVAVVDLEGRKEGSRYWCSGILVQGQQADVFLPAETSPRGSAMNHIAASTTPTSLLTTGWTHCPRVFPSSHTQQECVSRT
ncbi:hypothetical protein PR048_029695 [Dryococelus australis]|uniref:Uncharacterized protein n=1 Tax=Dryococelus australis TaxID=614101 RepID=A0ABQ9GG17_9NEOP|nr:hypothetical protein PR048_029695 [Dryococelus australis]